MNQHNESVIPVFDRPHAVALAQAKREFIHRFLPDLVSQHGLRTAIDIGCGFGYFAGYLKSLGLEVSAFDARPENAQETSRRNPECRVWVDNIESLSFKGDSFDIVLCLGLLYHLENPFLALRNLQRLTEKILVIETMVAPFSRALTALFEEGEGQDQSLNYVAQIASKAWLLKVLTKVGFPFIYEPRETPTHPDFHRSFLLYRRRVLLVASKVELSHGLLKRIQVPSTTNRYMWYRWGLSRILDSLPSVLKESLRSFAKILRLR